VIPDFLLKPFLMKFFKFAAVGLSGVFVDFGFTWLFKEKLATPKYLANAIGFTLASSTNYILNRIWTFQSHNPAIATEYMKFIGVSTIGLGINTLILWILVSKFRQHFYLSKLFAIGVVTLWNFVVNLFFTFTG